MKSTERHKLKQNEFARTVGRVQAALQARSGLIVKALAAVAVVIVLAGAYAWWRTAQEARGTEALAEALATYETPVVPPEPPAPGSPPPVPRPGTFQSEKERLEAALPKFLETAEAHPGSRPGVTARFYAGSILAALARYAEAEEHFNQVREQAGDDSLYGRSARLGMAEAQLAQGKYEDAIKIYEELSGSTASPMPADGILMHLGRAYVRAGRNEDAVRAFTRIVDEFPESAYAADARREMAEAKS